MIPDTVFGLPSHPLIVHGVVVLVPLTGLGLIAIAAVPKWRRAYGPLVAIGSVLAMLNTFAAGMAGQSLFERVNPQGAMLEQVRTHEDLAKVLPWLVLVQAVFAVALVLLDRRGAARGIVTAVAVVGVIAAGASMVQVARVGDAGSRAVWDHHG